MRLHVSSFLILAALASPAAMAQSPNFTLDPKGAVTAKLGYYPIPVDLTPTKPASIKKEPTYLGTPQYGILKVGNGPKSETVIALDDRPVPFAA